MGDTRVIQLSCSKVHGFCAIEQKTKERGTERRTVGEQQLHGVPQHTVSMEMLLCETWGTRSAGDGAAGPTAPGIHAAKKSLASQTSVYAQLNAEARIRDSLKR